MPFLHQPIFLDSVTSLLCEVPGRRFVDATIGGGGHAESLLRHRPDIELLGFDRDPNAIAAASARLSPFAGRFHLVQERFSQLAAGVHQHGWDSIDAIILDLGVSSPQLDTPERGFSFRHDAPLDMRMNPDENTATAADILNQYSETDIADVLYQYGEERKSRRIARAIVARRQEKPWQHTGELAQLLEKVVGHKHQYGLHPATRSFQALRIAVNKELDELEFVLPEVSKLLNSQGRCAIITFHSLEDRMVKLFFRQEAATCVCPPGFPVCRCQKQPTLSILTRKALRPDAAEVRANPRSSCAKLRAAEKI